jgi:hypothetical protein
MDDGERWKGVWESVLDGAFYENIYIKVDIHVLYGESSSGRGQR